MPGVIGMELVLLTHRRMTGALTDDCVESTQAPTNTESIRSRMLQCRVVSVYNSKWHAFYGVYTHVYERRLQGKSDERSGTTMLSIVAHIFARVRHLSAACLYSVVSRS